MIRSDQLDPVDLLHSYSAPPGWNSPVELTGPRADQRAMDVLERIIGGSLVASGPRRRHLRLVTGVVVVAALGGAAAVAAATLLSQSPSEARAVACWSNPVIPPATQVAMRWDGIADPISMCGGEWQGGDLGVDGPPEPLQACITTEGIAAVVPGDEGTCNRLGLATFAPIDPAIVDGNGVSPIDIAELESRLVDTFNFGPCREPGVVEAEVRVILDEQGASNWSVTIAGTYTADEPCASISVDPQTTTVLVVPG